MIISGVEGVPEFELEEFFEKRSNYCLLIPVINEEGRLAAELLRAQKAGIDKQVDIAICDGGSTDGSTEHETLKAMGVRALLTKLGPGKQGAQLRTGIYWALEQGYEGILTIDGNNKDSIESVPRFLEKLEEGYDLVQGSRFVKGGIGVNTPTSRLLAVRLLHAPVTSIVGKAHFTDTTNAFRAYSRSYLMDPRVQPLRDIFGGYELLAYLSTRAGQLGMKVCEVPVARVYPKEGKVPTKIKGFHGNADLLKILWENVKGKYNP